MNKFKTVISAMLATVMLLTVTACDESAPMAQSGTNTPVTSATTAATTTTFAENQGVNDAVDDITISLDNPDLEVTERIKWMAHYDIDETSAAAILFKNTYGTPEKGDDPNRDGRIFDYYSVAYAERHDKLAAAIAADDSPDLFPFDAMDFPYGVLKGRYQPIDDIIDLDSPKWAATKGQMEQYKLNDRYYCAFWEISLANIMYYRTSMIEEIGADDPQELFMAGNWNWDTFLDIARKWQLSAADRYVIDGYNPENDFLLSTGVPMIGNDGTKLYHNLNNPALERAEELLLTLQQENLRYPRHELNGWQVNPKAFANGNVLFYADGALWVWESTINKFAQRYGWADNEVKIVPFPKDPHADAHYVTLKQDSFMWVKGSKNENGVKAWLDCCVTASNDESIREASIQQAIDNYGWSRENLEFYYSLTTLNGTSPVTPIVEFKGGLGAVSDGSGVTNPIQSLTNLPYLTGDSFIQLRETHLPAIQSAIDEINAAIEKS